jgi:hypothetical protein
MQLIGDPTAALQAATKQYADAKLAGKTIPVPTASEDQKAIIWDNVANQFAFVSGMSNPMTTNGDLLYGSVNGELTRLPGYTDLDLVVLSQFGTGLSSAPPTWKVATELFDLSLNTYTLGTSAPISAGESALIMFGKIQAQINDALARTPVISNQAFSSTINLNGTGKDVVRVTLTGNCTINFTGGTDGQKLLLELKQDATGNRTANLGTGVLYGTDITGFTASTTANKTDILGLVYDGTQSKFKLIAVAKGY